MYRNSKESEIPQISQNGRLSMPLVIAALPELEPIWKEGLVWDYWTLEAEIACPQLADVLQKGLNARHSVQSGMDWPQVFKRACNLWLSDKGDGFNPTDNIVKNIMGANPVITLEGVADLVEIARMYAGCAEAMAALDVELARYSSKKRLNLLLISKLRAWVSKFKQDARAPQVVASVLMFFAHNLQSSISVPPSDMAALTRPSGMKNVHAFEGIIAEVNSQAKSVGLDPATCQAIHVLRLEGVKSLLAKEGTFDTNIADLVKQCKDRIANQDAEPTPIIDKPSPKDVKDDKGDKDAKDHKPVGIVLYSGDKPIWTCKLAEKIPVGSRITLKDPASKPVGTGASI